MRWLHHKPLYSSKVAKKGTAIVLLSQPEFSPLRWGGNIVICCISQRLQREVAIILLSRPDFSPLWWGGSIIKLLPSQRLQWEVAITLLSQPDFSSLWWDGNSIKNCYVSSTLSLPCQPIKNAQFEILQPLSSFSSSSIATKIHSIETRFVIGLEILLYAGVHMCTFQPGSFTGWGSEGINCSGQSKQGPEPPLLQRNERQSGPMFGVLHHQGFGVLHQLCPLPLWITVRWAFSS